MFGFQPRGDLADEVREIVEWYRSEGWIESGKNILEERVRAR